MTVVLVAFSFISLATLILTVARNPQLDSCESVAFVRQGLGAT